MTMRQQIAAETVVRWLVRVNGVVQGVGFRPFVHHLAGELALSGWVRNTDSGVEMAVQGPALQLQAFVERLQTDAPPLAHILTVETWPAAVVGDEEPGLAIRPSERGSETAGARTLLAPDVAVCTHCLEELASPPNRRYHYPFTTCTHCGPRYTIAETLPFDRPLTTMARFPLCPACERDYKDEQDRRFHAQATACPECGPGIWFLPSQAEGETRPVAVGEAAILQIARYLNDGRITAIKGLGGFHLACRADSDAAVRRLREAKARPHKPLAVMAADIQMVREFCEVSAAEAALLASPEAPIVLLRSRDDLNSKKLSELVAPQQDAVGVMLPYTPLHHLLLQAVKAPLVMTSGNRAGEPLCIDNEEALEELRPLCDGFLLHDRLVAHRCDDSVAMVTNLGERTVVQPVRRSRGYVPVPVLLPSRLALAEGLVAVGGDLKNVSAAAAGREVFLTHYIGNLEGLNVRAEQARAVADFEQLFRVRPETIVCDLHPNYAGGRYARERAAAEGLRLIEVQHHHAHIAGCLAENDRSDPAVGLAFDGTGYGPDGRIWGGEVLLAGAADFKRLFHLEYLPLPGGDAAVRRPYRTAIAYLLSLCPQLSVTAVFPKVPVSEIEVIEGMVAQSLNTPLTSSMGRLFDAVSAMLGLCCEATYEGQAAMALEAAARQSDVKGRYYFGLEGEEVQVGHLLCQLWADRLQGAPVRNIARRFHNTIAALSAAGAEAAVREAGERLPVALSGGVWQNRLLLELTVPKLRRAGFEVLLHRQVPANDGGLAYGQAAVAAGRLLEEKCA